MKDKRINNVVKMIIINSSLSYKSILNCIDMETVRRETDTALEDSYKLCRITNACQQGKLRCGLSHSSSTWIKCCDKAPCSKAMLSANHKQNICLSLKGIQLRVSFYWEHEYLYYYVWFFFRYSNMWRFN